MEDNAGGVDDALEGGPAKVGEGAEYFLFDWGGRLRVAAGFQDTAYLVNYQLPGKRRYAFAEVGEDFVYRWEGFQVQLELVA